jgi:hypothetical protein
MGYMQGERRWSRRGLVALFAMAALGSALAAPGGRAEAAALASRPRIDGGVEDGTFSPTCLRGKTPAPDTGVLGATQLRSGIGDVFRILVPFNIATKRSTNAFKCLNSYLADAASLGATVEVSLNRVAAGSRGPSLARYATAVHALARTEGSRIRYLTAWNEPNNRQYLRGAHAARQAGQFFRVARKFFPDKMVAGDFASGVSAAFLSAYIKAIGRARPSIWAIHPYTDVTNFQYYLHSGVSPQRAGALAAARSKVLQLARHLHGHHYGSRTRIWINEIYVDHRADKRPPGGVSGAKGRTRFSLRNQAYAALFLSGGLGADSLHGVLTGKNLPQLTRYIYLRARDASTNQQPRDADVLQVHFPGCLFYTLAGSRTTPAPQCS